MDWKYIYYLVQKLKDMRFFYNPPGKCNILSTFVGGCKNRGVKLLILKSKKQEDPERVCCVDMALRLA